MPHESRNTKTITSSPSFAAHNQSISGISKTAVPLLQKAPVEKDSEDGPVQMYGEHAADVNAFSLPGGNKPGENRNDPVKPVQLKDTNIGEVRQEEHSAPEAWHVVQQQGRVLPASRMKDSAGLRSNKGDMSEKPIQRMVKYEFNFQTRTFFNVKYIRTNQPLTLIGKMHGKHATADAAQAPVYELGLEGRTLGEGLEYLTGVARAYLNMPGNYLMDFHMNQTGNVLYNPRNEGIPHAFDRFHELHKKLQEYVWISTNLVQIYKDPREEQQDRIAFEMLSMVNNISYNLGEFRDLLPLVNLHSKGEKGGKEKEAKASLSETELSLRKGGNITEKGM